MRRKSSTLKYCDEVLDGEEVDSRAKDGSKRQLADGVTFNSYAAFFQAAQNNIYVAVVFIVFVGGQFIRSGNDYFLSQW